MDEVPMLSFLSPALEEAHPQAPAKGGFVMVSRVNRRLCQESKTM